ncbi:Ig-like domain-containing protein [Weissella bombi]|uniref:Ig-like domain-containing protein n=1 Tax=Weissella bombi TaxID=1505725 RepID=UPI003AF20A7E
MPGTQDETEPVENDASTGDETDDPQNPEEGDETQPEEPEEPIKVSSFDLDKSEVTVDTGEEVKVNVLNIIPENATDKTIVASSNDAEIATVMVHTDGSIGIKGIKAGSVTAVVKSNDGGATKELTINVKNPIISVTDVAFETGTAEVEVGQSITPNVKVSPENATDKSGSYQSDNSEIATVDQSGKITGIKAGTTAINFIANDGKKKASIAVTVKESTVSVTGIAMAADNATTGETGTNIELNALISPENATNKNINWQLSDESLAEFSTTEGDSSHRILKLLKAGNVDVTATTEDGGKVAKQSIKITDPIVKMTEFEIDKSDLMGDVGNTDELVVSNIQPTNTTDKTLDLSLDDSDIVDVHDNGDGSYSISYLQPGSTVIHLNSHDGGVEKAIPVTVNEPVPDEPELATWEYMLINHDSTVYPAPSLDTYTVKAGETLADIATDHMMSLAKLKKLNKLTVNVLPAGRVIRLS